MPIAGAMEFRFINNNEPLDRRSQRLVRSHAMKGKNLGRTLPLKNDKRKQHEDRMHRSQLETQLRCSVKGGKGRPLLPKPMNPSLNTAPPSNPFSGDELAYFAMPVPPTSSIRYLFYECGWHLSTPMQHSLTKLL
jgi:hypothetical protein